MPRPVIGAVLAAVALTLGGAGAAAVAAPLPGPKQPPEHAAISGAFFQVKTGTPGCFTGAGTLGAAFPVPGGAVVTGATLYVIDGQTSANVFGALNKHDLTSGGTSELARGNTSGIAGTTRIELVVNGGAVVASGQAINLSVTVGGGTCFKGAEVHYLRAGGTTGLAPGGQSAARGYSPDGEHEAAR